MPRPRKCRRIGHQPPVTFYKPQGVPLGQLKGVVLTMEGLEALRLVDAEGLSQEEAAVRMEVSRPTVCRILGEGRAVVARALANGWAIRIENPEDREEAEGGGGGGRCRRRGGGCSGRGRNTLPDNKEES